MPLAGVCSCGLEGTRSPAAPLAAPAAPHFSASRFAARRRSRERWTALRASRIASAPPNQRAQDSLYAIRKHARVSVERVRLRLVRQREDSVAMERDLLDGPPTPTLPDSGAWLGDDRTGAYYRVTCKAAQRISVDHRIYFPVENYAQSAHLWRSRSRGVDQARPGRTVRSIGVVGPRLRLSAHSPRPYLTLGVRYVVWRRTPWLRRPAWCFRLQLHK